MAHVLLKFIDDSRDWLTLHKSLGLFSEGAG